MPLYEYQCTECGQKTEVLQRFEDAPLAVCPACGGAVKKLISSPAFQFKGSGWYVTDYARKGGSAAGREAGSGDSPAGAAGTDGAAGAATGAGAAGAGEAPAKAAESAAPAEAKAESGSSSKEAAKPAPSKPALSQSGSKTS